MNENIVLWDDAQYRILFKLVLASRLKLKLQHNHLKISYNFQYISPDKVVLFMFDNYAIWKKEKIYILSK